MARGELCGKKRAGNCHQKISAPAKGGSRALLANRNLAQAV